MTRLCYKGRLEGEDLALYTKVGRGDRTVGRAY